MTKTGYNLEIIDSDNYMLSEDTCSVRMFISSDDVYEPGEVSDIEEHLNSVVAAAIQKIQVPAELKEITGQVNFPDEVVDDDDTDVTRGIIDISFVFNRNLF